MENRKISSAVDHVSSGNGYSVTVPLNEIDKDGNGNYFLIGLNIRKETQNEEGGDILQENKKFPVFMLKIDTGKFLSNKNAQQNEEGEECDNEYSEIISDNQPKVISGNFESRFEPADSRPRHENLSNREMQVLKLIALGKTRKEIASGLFLSISTINTYRSRILEKMGMKNNAELMRYAFKQKLVE